MPTQIRAQVWRYVGFGGPYWCVRLNTWNHTVGILDWESALRYAFKEVSMARAERWQF